jgi:hypothetical protein
MFKISLVLNVISEEVFYLLILNVLFGYFFVLQVFFQNYNR